MLKTVYNNVLVSKINYNFVNDFNSKKVINFCGVKNKNVETVK